MKRFDFYQFVGPAVIFLIWYFLSAAGLVNSFFIPKPTEVIASFYSLVISGSFWIDVFSTFYRTLSALMIGVAFGVTIGLLMGYFSKIYRALEFIIEFFRSTPAIALFPLFMLFFGIGDLAKVMLTFWAVTFIIIVHTIYGVFHGKRLRRRVAATMGFKGFLLFRTFIFPEALPQILAGARIAFSTSLILVLATEMFVGTDYGMGRRIMDFQMVYRIPEMYAVIVSVGLLGFILNKIFIKFERRIVHWMGR